MGTIDLSSYKPVAGTETDANQIASGFDVIQNVINGGLDENNLKSSGKIINLARLMQGGAASKQGLIWNGTDWVPADSLQSLMTGTGDLVYSASANTPTRLAAGTNGHVLTLAAGLPTWAAPAATTGMTLLDDQLLVGDSTGSVTMPAAGSLSGSYKALVVDLYLRTSEAVTVTNVSLRFNGDTGNNYDSQYMQVNNTTVSGAINSAQSSIVSLGAAVGSSGTANRFGACRFTIPHYAGATNHKSVTGQSYADGGGTTNAFTRYGGGQWRSASAITSITAVISSGNFKAGSRFTVYGLS